MRVRKQLEHTVLGFLVIFVALVLRLLSLLFSVPLVSVVLLLGKTVIFNFALLK